MKKKTILRKKKGSPVKTCCHICNKYITGGKYHFMAHLYKHRAIEPRYKCKYCPKEYFRNDCYIRHKNLHEGKTHRKYFCDYCDRGFVNKQNLILHLKIHDDVFHDKFSFKCNACYAVYSEYRCLKHHIRRVHCNLQDSKPLHVDKLLNETWVEGVKNTKVCVEMKKVNNNVLSIKLSKSTISQLSSSQVNVKNSDDFRKKQSNKREPKRNIFVDDNTQYSKAICDYCNKAMLKKSLRKHIKERHLKIRNFSCTECKKTFKRNYQLVNHRCGIDRRRRKNVDMISMTN